MSRHVSITELLVAVCVISGCSSGTVTKPQSQTVLHIDHCLGDVVPVCTSVRVDETGLLEYGRRGKRILTGRLAQSELNELRQHASALDVSSWLDNDDPVGSFVTLEIASGKRTITIVNLPDDAVAVLQMIDRVGQRLFGKAYRSIVPSESTRRRPPSRASGG
jgi:hypothetical protein